MPEAFKNLINADTVAHAGRHLQRVWPAFDRPRFESLAGTGLDDLEFKARAMQIANALEHTLPPRFDAAARVLERSLSQALPLDAQGEPVGLSQALAEKGLSGWVVWAMGEFVARRGMDDVPRALACLHALTQRFSAEFAIRPFIARYPDQVFPILAQWTQDPSAHVRRLASEGSRPRLPWGMRLQSLVDDPAPAWPLLRALQDDPSAYVRRSVANHLNDIAKDHPDRVASWLVTELRGASAQRTALLKHASRSLIKQGHAATLSAWGLQPGLVGQATLKLAPSTAAVGESVDLRATLHSRSEQIQTLVVDYAVHHQRANGSTSPKVFKGWKLALGAGEKRVLDKRHSLRAVTTRKLYPGVHRVDLLVNGQVLASDRFELLG